MGLITRIMKKAADISLDMSDSRNDHIITSTLPNSIKLASQIRLLDRNFHFAAILGSGAYEDPQGKEGTAHFLEHVLITPAVQQAFKSRQGYVGLATSMDRIAITGHLENSPENRDFAYNYLHDMLISPVPEADVERERIRIHNEINISADNPDKYTWMMTEGIFESGRGLLSILGTHESLNSITVDDLQAYKDKWFTGGNLYLAFTGFFKGEKLHTDAPLIFGDISSKETSRSIMPRYIPNDIFSGVQDTHQLYFQIIVNTRPPQTRIESSIHAGACMLLSEHIDEAFIERYGVAYAASATSTSTIGRQASLIIQGNIMPEQAGQVVPISAEVINHLCSDEAMPEIENFVRRGHYAFQHHAPKILHAKSPETMAEDLRSYGSTETAKTIQDLMLSITAKDFQDYLRKSYAEGAASIIAHGRADKLHSGAHFQSLLRLNGGDRAALSASGEKAFTDFTP